MMRATTISRSAAGTVSMRVAIGLLLLLEVFDVLVEAVERLVPEPLEPADPGVDRLEPPRVERVDTLLPRLAHAHQAHFAQHAEVLGGTRLRHAQRARPLLHRALPLLEEREDAPALRVVGPVGAV